jgi:hypothetical protein
MKHNKHLTLEDRLVKEWEEAIYAKPFKVKYSIHVCNDINDYKSLSFNWETSCLNTTNEITLNQ